MIRVVTVFFVIAFVTTAQAQSLPERFMVTDVASDDVLNIRAEPSSSSDIIGEFGPYTLNVEVLRTRGGWGYTGAGERSGWVSMRYLTPNPVPENELPRPLACFGTEPFWDVTFYPRGTEYNFMGEEPVRLSSIREYVAANGYFVEAMEAPTISRSIMINAMSCNDGMSDRDFGMSITMFTHSTEGNSVQTGCCTMQVN